MKKKLKPTNDLMNLPKLGNRWYCARRRIPIWLRDEREDGEDRYAIPWLYLVVEIKSGMVLESHLCPEELSTEEAFDFLYNTMISPTMPGEIPYRPSDIHFEQKDLAESLRQKLQEYGISAYHRPNSGAVDFLYSEMASMLRANDEDGLLDGLMKVPGVTPNLVERFFHAAAEFFAAEPWIWLSNFDVLKIQVEPKSVARYVVVMGQAGIDYGLSVHQKLSDIEEMYLIDNLDEGSSQAGRHIFSYNEAPLVAIDDLLDAANYGWEVPSPDFFPTPLVYVKRGFSRPDAAMLHWYEAVLKALVIFVKDRLDTFPDGSHPPVTASIEVDTSKGKTPVLIEFPGGDLSVLEKPVPPQKMMPDDGDGEESPPDFSQYFGMHRLEREMFSKVYEIDGYQPIWTPEVHIAQEIVYDAWEAPNPIKQIQMAKAALRVSPDCGDAYLILAEAAASYEDALHLYQQGIEASKRALREDFFQVEENQKHYWAILETRPLLRCLLGKASSLEKLKRWQEAEETYRHMLTINPGDNQGIRYLLLYFFFERGMFDVAVHFLKEYKNDPSIEWLYCRPLLEFRFKGPGKAAERALRKAIKYNPHVPELLLSRKRIPSQEPEHFSLGGVDEAVVYAGMYLNHWRRTPGAVAWLKESISLE